jgi:hypothetical protein
VKALSCIEGKVPVVGNLLTKKVKITQIEAIVMLSKFLANFSKRRHWTEMEAVRLFAIGMNKSEEVIKQVGKAVQKTSPVMRSSFVHEFIVK